jgi:hypothetical protein
MGVSKDSFKVIKFFGSMRITPPLGLSISAIKKKETEVLKVIIDGEEKSFDIDVNFFDS